MMYIHRTMCEVLSEMRDCYETRNYSNLLALVEEAQSKANRMEAALYGLKDIEALDRRWSECKEKDKALDLLKEYIERKERICQDG